MPSTNDGPPEAAATSPKASQRVFLDCTGTYLVDVHTGVQRLVRNVVRHGRDEGLRRGVTVVPCFFEEGRYFAAPMDDEGGLVSRGTAGAGIDEWSRRKRRYWTLMGRVASVVPESRLRRWLMAPAARPGLARTARAVMRATGTFPGPALGNGAKPLVFRAGDILLTLDLAWEDGLEAALRVLKTDGVRLAAVFYDLIPIRYPEGLPESFIRGYRAWVDTVVRRADLVIGISDTVVADLRRYFAEAPMSAATPLPVLASFRPGHGLDRRDKGGAIRPELARIFSNASEQAVFLSVGWLDERKNQQYVLEALKRLPPGGVAPRWVVAGKHGPTTDAVLARFRQEPQLAERIFLFEDLSDGELEFCYRNASALIYPSRVEGFGLPMVEAMSRGLRVFASDIAVFREVGEGFAVYFPLDGPEVLAEQLGRFCRNGEFPAARDIRDFRWPDWQASTRQLFDIVLAHLAQPAR